MRRSSSASHIPVRPRSSVRSSGDGIDKRKRSGSVEGLRGFGFNKKPTGLFPRKQSGATACTPQVAGRGPGSASRLITPSSTGSSRSRGRSPYRNNINDKKWVAQQHIKVLQYLNEMYSTRPELEEIELKPPSLQSFAIVVNVLLKEIDPRVEITVTNYKDIVFNMLKALRYPGSITMSLLKTVNTMHAWPQVMCMFSWLVDLVKLIKGVDDPPKLDDFKSQRNDCILNYLIRRYTLYNSDEREEMADEEFKTTFNQILNIDENQLEQQRDYVAQLSELEEKRKQEISLLGSKIETMSKERVEKQEEMDRFYKNSKLEKLELEKNIAQEEAKLAKLKELNEIKRQSNTKLREKVEKQKYTVDDKKKLLERIENLKHTNSLMRNRNELRRKMKTEYEQENNEMRKEIQNEVFRFNNSLLDHIVIEPALKKFEVKCEDFSNITPEFANQLQALSSDLKSFETMINNKIKGLRTSLQSIKNENAELTEEIALYVDKLNCLQNDNYKVEEKIADCKKKCGELQNLRMERKKKFDKDINELSSHNLNLDQLEKSLLEAKARTLNKRAELDRIKKEIVVFFVKIREKSLTNAQAVLDIHNKVVQKMEDSLVQINEVEAEIENDMYKLEEIRKK